MLKFGNPVWLYIYIYGSLPMDDANGKICMIMHYNYCRGCIVVVAILLLIQINVVGGSRHSGRLFVLSCRCLCLACYSLSIPLSEVERCITYIYKSPGVSYHPVQTPFASRPVYAVQTCLLLVCIVMGLLSTQGAQ